MESQPKHRDISQQLLAEIATGNYASSGRLPTEVQLVKRFQVSRPTVARALRDLEAEGLIERRAGSGTYLRGPQAKASFQRQLGLLIPNLGTTEIFEVICGELANLARAHGHTLLWGDAMLSHSGHPLSKEDAVKLCDQFIEQAVAGVYFAPFERLSDQEKINQHIADRLTKAGIPLVLLDRDLLPFPRRSNFDLVGIDNLAGGCLLAEHLIKLGARRLAFVAQPHMAPTINARIAGVREALAAHHLEDRPDWINVGNPEDLKFARSLTGGSRWDALVCANDLIAAQLLRLFEKDKVRVPRDLRLVGFDDAKYASLLGVSLTTMRQPCREIAIAAFCAMKERITDPTLPARSVLLTPQLVVRESCGAYLPRSKSD
jgi:LacI family transcriptional regulator